jgi:heme exporter protein C
MRRIQLLMGVVALAAALGIAFAYSAPPDAQQRKYALIMHIHVPSAFLAFVAFGVTALGSIVWRITKNRRWDRTAAASAEIGVIFTAVALLTGMIWGRPVWGRAWDWGDARMSTTALMFFVYLGYLALRRAIPDPEVRAARASILGMIAVVQVPLVYFSVNLWRTLHQPHTLRVEGSPIHPAMLRALLINLATFSVIFVALLAARLRLGRLEEEAETAAVELAGAAVRPPLLGGASNV